MPQKLRSIRKYINHPYNSKYVSLLALLVITAIVPLTVYESLHSQNTYQFASTQTSSSYPSPTPITALPFGQATQFNDDNARIQFPTVGYFQGGTIEEWIKPTFIDGNSRAVIASNFRSNPNSSCKDNFEVSVHKSSFNNVDGYTVSLDFIFGNGTPSVQLWYKRALPLSVWANIAFTLDYFNNATLYVNGNNVDSLVLPQSICINNGGIILGAQSDMITNFQGTSFKGFIDEVRISHIARYSGPFYAPVFSPFSPDPDTDALWHLDSNVNDSTSNNYSGQIVGTVSFSPSTVIIPNTAALFNGGYITVDNSASLNPQLSFTVEARVKLQNISQTQGTGYRLISKDNDLIGGSSFQLAISISPIIGTNNFNVTYLFFVINSKDCLNLSQYRYVTVETMNQLLAWKNIAGVIQPNGQLDLFLNGKRLVATTPASIINTCPKNVPIKLGYSVNGVNNFTGLMEEVRISTIARYQTDYTPAIQFLPDEYTVVLYHLNGFTLDASGNKRNGITTGNVTFTNTP